jgi:hypothetical protein
MSSKGNLCCGQDLADSWVTLPNQNPLFAGETPVDYMILDGRPGMEQVRRLLDAGVPVSDNSLAHVGC